MTDPYNAGVGGPAWRAQQRRRGRAEPSGDVEQEKDVSGEPCCARCGHLKAVHAIGHRFTVCAACDCHEYVSMEHGEDDIVERLEKWSDTMEAAVGSRHPLCDEAAALIRRLRAQVPNAREEDS